MIELIVAMKVKGDVIISPVFPKALIAICNATVPLQQLTMRGTPK
jgi:hypothetical protein